MIQTPVWLSRLLVVSTLGLMSACSNFEREQLENGGQYQSVDYYRSLDGHSYIPCRGYETLFQCGEYLYARPKVAGLETGLIHMASDWADCSTPVYECILNSGYVLAVPQSGLHAGTTYSTNGAAFKVQKIFTDPFRSDDASFLITSTCIDDCGCWDEDRYAVSFYFNPKVGVTGILLARKDEPGIADAGESWMLVADEGFLKANLSLENVGDISACDY